MTSDCPGDNTLAAVVEGQAGEDPDLVEHLARCDVCQRLVAKIVRGDGDATPRYKIETLIGTGGMGLVLRAFDTVLERPVAVKMLWQASPAVLDEARMLARFSHPNIVTVHDAGVLEPLGVPFIAMELVEGCTLRDWLARRRPWREIVEVFVAAGRGLAAAHASDVVHADFKPSNVVLADGGARVLVTDFGLARRGEPGADTATGGTPRYAAPELAKGPPDARSDQYAFGVALYEALLGRHPSLIDECPAPGCERVPRRLERAVRRCIAVEPHRRFRSMDAALAAIAPRNRTTVIAIATVAACGLAVGAVAAWPDACDRKGNVERWEARLRPALGDALGPDAFARVAPLADAWVGTWTERAELECRNDGGGVVRACIEARWATLEAVVERIREADADAAALAVARLPPVSECRRPTGAARSAEITAEAMTASASALAQGRAAWLLGDVGGAQAQLERAVELAQTSELLGLQAEAVLLLGKVHWFSAQRERAFAEYSEAADLAVRAGLPDLAAVAMGSAAQFVAHDRRETTVARTLLQQARALASQGDDPMTRLNLDRNEAWIVSGTGDNVAAARLMRAALQRLHDNPLGEATCAADLGAFLMWSGELDASLDATDRAIALRTATLGPTHPQVAHAKRGKAAALMAADRYADAAVLLQGLGSELTHDARLQLADILLEAGQVDAAAVHAEQLDPGAPRGGLVRQLRARVALAQGDAERARALLQALLEESPGTGARSPRATSSLQRDLGRAELALGNFGAARRWLELAVAVPVALDRTTAGDLQFELAQALAAGGRCETPSRAAARRAIDAYRDKATETALARAQQVERWLRECANEP